MKIVYTILIIAKAFDFISTIIAGLGAEVKRWEILTKQKAEVCVGKI